MAKPKRKIVTRKFTQKQIVAALRLAGKLPPQPFAIILHLDAETEYPVHSVTLAVTYEAKTQAQLRREAKALAKPVARPQPLASNL